MSVYQLWYCIGIRFCIPVDYTPRTNRGITEGDLGESLSQQPANRTGSVTEQEMPCHILHTYEYFCIKNMKVENHTVAFTNNQIIFAKCVTE